MAIIMFEDFEPSTALSWIQSATNFGTNAAMFGRCCSMGSATAEFYRYAKKNLPSSYSEGLVSFAFSISSILSTANYRILSIMNSSTHQIGLYMNTDGSLSVSRNTSVLYTTSPVILNPNVRYRIELGFSISGSTGTLRLKVNNVELFNLTSQDTRNGIDNFNAVQFGNLAGVTDYFDDILVDTDKTAFRGDFYGECLVPTSDVSGYSTPSTGSNRWAVVDELPSSLTDYTSFPNTGTDRYGLSNLSSSPAAIYGVLVRWIAQKNDTQDCVMRSLLYSGTGTYTGSGNVITVGYLDYQDIVEVDPNTSSSWTASSINALELGIERTV